MENNKPVFPIISIFNSVLFNEFFKWNFFIKNSPGSCGVCNREVVHENYGYAGEEVEIAFVIIKDWYRFVKAAISKKTDRYDQFFLENYPFGR